MFEENYRALACAIIKQAYNDFMTDYRKNGEEAVRIFEDFCNRSCLFPDLELDNEHFFMMAVSKARRKYGGKKNG